MFTDASDSEDLKTRHTDYNIYNQAEINRGLEKSPFKQIIENWNALDIDLKSTTEDSEVEILLKEKFLSQNKFETDCSHDCYSGFGS